MPKWSLPMNSIVDAFRFFIAIRLLLWLLFYNGAGTILGNSARSPISIQTFGIIILLESLVLIVLSLAALTVWRVSYMIHWPIH